MTCSTIWPARTPGNKHEKGTSNKLGKERCVISIWGTSNKLGQERCVKWGGIFFISLIVTDFQNHVEYIEYPYAVASLLKW